MLFEDAVVSISLAKQAAIVGETHIRFKQQPSSLDEVSSEHVEHAFTCASLTATALFESLGAHGTNIVCAHEDDEVVIKVYPRTSEDDLGINWEPKPGDSESIKQIASKVSDAFWYVGKEDSSSQKSSNLSSDTGSVNEKKKSHNPDDYRIKQLRRSP